MTKQKQIRVPANQRHQNAGVSLPVGLIGDLKTQAEANGMYYSQAVCLLLDHAVKNGTLRQILAFQEGGKNG